MKKNFLLLLVLTLLPLAGWAQWTYTNSHTIEWKDGSSTKEIAQGTTPAFSDLVIVRSNERAVWGPTDINQDFDCMSLGVGTGYPSGDEARYYYNVYETSSSTTPVTASPLPAGDYVLRLFVRYVSGATAAWSGGSWGLTANAWNNTTVNLPFKVIAGKPEVTVKVFAITKEWKDPWDIEPTIADFNATAELRQVTGGTTNWDLVKDYLEFKRVDNGTDVGTYYYTLSLKSVHPTYVIHIDDASAKLNITQTTNVAGTVSLEDWTYGETAKTPVATGFKYGNDLAEFTYSEDDVTYTDEVPTNAGTYYVKATVPETINYTEVSAKSTFKINQRELVKGTDFTAPTALTGIDYNESAQEIATAGEFIGSFKDEIIAAGAKFQYDGADALPTKTNVNTYSFNWTISVPATSNFKYTTGATTVSGATIIEADITATDVTAPVGKTGLKYILDTPQELIATAAVVADDSNTGAPKGEAYYSVDGGTWTNDLTKVVGEHVKASDGKYVVSWYIKGDANHNDYYSESTPAGTVEVAIAPVQFALVADAEVATGLVFDNTAQQLLTKSVTGGAANMPQGSTSWSLDGTALAAGSTYTDVKATHAGTYTISYTVVPKEAKYENDYLPYTKELTANIDQYTLYIGGNEIKGKTIEDVVNLEDGTPLISMADFIKDGALIGGESDADKATILNSLIAPTQTLEEIFANAKVGVNAIGLQAVTVTPAKNKLTNYKVDGPHLLSNAASLEIIAKEAAIQAAPVGYADDELTYNGAPQELIKTAAVGYKAMGGNSTSANAKAIGKVVYSLEETGPYTDAPTTITKTAANQGTEKYTVYYKVELSEEATSLDRFYEYTAGVKSIQVKINKKELALGMFTFDPASLTAEYTGGNLKPTVTAFDAVAGDAEKNALTENDFTVTVTNSDGDEETGDLKNVGVYTFTFTAKADGNYTDPATAVSADFEITPKALTADMFELSAGVTYNGEAQQPTITAADEAPAELTADDWDYEIKNSKGTVVKIDEMVNADTYTFRFFAKAGNYKDATEPITKTFVIAPKALADGMFTLGPDDLEYTGADQKASVTVTATDKKGDKNIITTEDFVETKVEYGTPAKTVDKLINAGTYTYTFTGQGNYTGTAQATISIAKIDADVYKPEKIDLTYNNTDQHPVTEGTTDAIAGAAPEDFDGKVEYRIVQGEEVLVDWTDKYADVVIKNAGDYTVNYKITASEVNYNNPLVTGEIKVSMLKAEISYTLGNVSKDWDGKPFTKEEINKLFAINNGELFEGDKYDRPFDFVVPEDYKDAGTYFFTVSQEDVVFKTIEGGYDKDYPVNYDVKVTGEAKLVINKVDIVAADFVAPEAAPGLVYINGTAQDLIAEGYEVTTKYTWDGDTEGTPIGTIVFATAEDGEYSETVPQGTAADNYSVWYKVAGDKNHNDTDPVEITNTIAANASGFQLAFEDATWTYDGVEFYPADVNAYDGKTATEPGIATDPETDYDFALTKDGEEFSGKLKDAGTYVFTYTGKGNYAGSSAKATLVITPKNIADADVTVTLSATTAEFNNDNQKPTYEVKYSPAEKPELTLVEAEGENANDFSVAADDDMTTGGEYTFTFTGNGNYTGTKTAKFNITKRKVIAQAENCEKDYDGFYGLAIDGGTVEVPITWGNLVPGDKNVPTLDEGAITVDPLKKDVGKYAIIVDGSKFISDNYEVIKGDREAWLTINPIDLKVKWAGKASKIYGSADPALASYLVIEGAVGAEVDDIRANTVITRAKGETVGKYDVDLAAKANADVFKNYVVDENTFEGAKQAFEINKAKLIASLAPQTVTYTGVKAKLYDEGKTLPSDQLVVNGLLSVASLGINDYKDVVSNIVVNIPNDAINVGDYEITIASAEAENYEFEFLPATLTIEPLDISKATVTIPEQQVRVGDLAAEVIDAENFTIEFEGFYADDAAAFKVAAAGRFVEDGKIKDAADHESGLVLVAANPTIAYNYTGWETGKFVGNLIVVGGQTILLDDQQDIATTAKDDVNVTFTSRNVLQDNWNVVCLPFAVTVSEISDAFGYAAVDILNEEATDGDMHFKVVSSGIIDAGVPFIVKPTSDKLAGAKSNFNQITFYGVDVKAFSANPTPVADNAGNKFCGTFMKETLIAGNGADKFWYMSKGMWKSAKNFTDAKPVTLAAYRAYIELASAEARIFVEEPDGSITAIDAIDFAKAETGEGWYTINGMKLDAAPTQKGTYIKDGKKVLVK